MDYSKFFENMMGMSDAAWQRHANPWSVWTRFATLPFLALAIWSRAWLDIWSLLPIGVLIVWIFVNPRFFNKPASTHHWSSKATFGERVWINRKNIPIPAHHVRAPHVLSFFTGLGLIPLVYGLVYFDVVMTTIGVIWVMAFKLWFLDRMVWLYQDMIAKHEDYRTWLYPKTPLK